MRTAYIVLTMLLIASCGDDAAEVTTRCDEVRDSDGLIQKCGHPPPGYYDAGTSHPGIDAGHPPHDAGADDADAGADTRE